jgi:type I restriction enzyme S subunit
MRSKAYWEQITVVSKGTAQPGANASVLSALSLPLPPLAEQRRIAAQIDALFARTRKAKEALDRIPPLLKRLKKSILSAAFSPPAQEAAVPWRWLTLGEIAEVVGGVTKGQKRKGGHAMRMVPYLRVANVQRGWLNLSEMSEIEATEEDIEALRLQPGDVLFNEGGDRDKLGRGWVWEGALPLCIHQNHVFRARPAPHINPKFLSLYANELGQDYFAREGKQSTNLASINMTKLKGLPVPVPPRVVQDRITERVEQALLALKQLAGRCSATRSRIDALESAILAKAFRGELVPQDPNDEPASVLLERIRAERAAAPAKKARGRLAAAASAR